MWLLLEAELPHVLLMSEVRMIRVVRVSPTEILDSIPDILCVQCCRVELV